ncbi:MAG: ribosome biogenesis GTPase YlqF, partial [Comamonas sp.]
YDDELVALELLLYLQKNYARQLDERYKLGLADAEIAALHDDELLALIGKKRGAVMSGGRINLQKAAELVITDYRTQMIGRITLETPTEFEAWRAAGEEAEALAKAKKAEHEKHRKAGRKRY